MLLGSWDPFLKKNLQRTALTNMEQCFNLCSHQNLQSGQKLPRNLSLVASQQLMFYLFVCIQIKGMTLLFVPYFILLRIFWRSFETTVTCPCPGGRVGTKCPILWTFTLVTLLIIWMVPQKAVGSFIQTEVWLKEELLSFEYWYSTIFLFCYFCLKWKVLVW